MPDNDPSPTRLRELVDRQDILDCVYRGCRGIDRLDSALVASAYHPDAIDNHGVFCGPVAEFIEWAFAGHRAAHHGHHHYVMNHTCDLDGDVAHTETYYIFAAQNVRGTPHTLHGGRYVDRFERRDGRWAIAYRTSLLEWVGGSPSPTCRRRHACSPARSPATAQTSPTPGRSYSGRAEHGSGAGSRRAPHDDPVDPAAP